MKKKTTFAEFIRSVEAEARAEGPEAVAQLELMRQRYNRGGQIAMLRKRRKLTQPALAKRSGVEQADISRIERGLGNPTEETLTRVAHALGARIAFVDKKDRAVAV